MSLHVIRLRFRRLRRRTWSKIINAVIGASEQFDKNFLGRVGRIRYVWKFMVVWTLLFLLAGGGLLWQSSNLKTYYQVQKPAAGGIFSEGIEGSFTTANPLYAVNDVDSSVSRLLFAGLLSFDNHNQLAGDLADRWSVNTNGTVYTVYLRPNLTWQDGKPLTADDVVFTYQTIQNPDAQSPLLSSWQGVKVAAIDSRTVQFTLPNPLSSFAYGLTNGIVPRHILGQLSAVDLRSAAFNTNHPVGAGPFSWQNIGISGIGDSEEEQIIFKPFAHYWAGAPKLDSFSVHAYAKRATMIKDFRGRQVTAVAGLDRMPAGLASGNTIATYNMPLTAGTYIFFKTTDPLLQDVRIRQALVLGANRQEIIDHLGYQAVPVDEPILHGQIGYDPAFSQATAQLDQAKAILDAAGWTVGPDGVRMNKGQPLSVTLSAIDNDEYRTVTDQLRKQWQLLGVDTHVTIQQPDSFKDGLAKHEYQAVLDGISIGPDPDVFVYWDSSQNDVRSQNQLNFSEYSSPIADAALEAGRTRLDSQLRVVKYRPFLQAWQKDYPALGLYQPRFLYLSHVPIYGLQSHQINSDADRFTIVNNWMIHVAWTTR